MTVTNNNNNFSEKESLLQALARAEQQYNSVNSERSVPSVQTDNTAQSIDYETLLTLALESTSRDTIRRAKRKQKIIITVISVLLVISIGMIGTLSYENYPEEERLHKEINTLQSDIDELRGEMNTVGEDANVEALKRDIEQKKDFVSNIENDDSLDDKTKAEIVRHVKDEIVELRKIIADYQESVPADLSQQGNVTYSN